ncbi:MAG TPA: phage holin family protein [Terrimicrobiaceae bacterium]|nr:phage holin family protein [Terrimicrobiaceae bacterium]
MAETVLPPSAGERETPRGALPELLRFAGTFGHHVQGLVQLASVESKEAAMVGLRLLALVIASVVFAIFGYVLILFFIAFLLAIVFNVSWIWISLGLAVLHFLALAICALIALKSLRSPFFKATAAELKRDFEALKSFKP